MTDIIIRDAVAGDIPAIAAIYAEAVANGVASYELVPPTTAEMAERFAAIAGNGYPYRAACAADGRLIGYAYASAFRTRPAYRWLVEDSIYLAPDARGRGLGHRLLEDLVACAEVAGFRQMIAVIGGAHPASIALHRRLDFVEIGRITGSGFKHGRWLDTALMQRPLGAGTGDLPDPDRYPGTLFSA